MCLLTPLYQQVVSGACSQGELALKETSVQSNFKKKGGGDLLHKEHDNVKNYEHFKVGVFLGTISDTTFGQSRYINVTKCDQI